MIFSTAKQSVLFSKYATLLPGDMLWTGTSGKTPQ